MPASFPPVAIARAAELSLKSPTVLYPPEFDRTAPALAFFKLRNNTRDDTNIDYLTFGQMFRQGDVFPGVDLGARYDETILPAQMDAKATYSDGSVRHAAITIETPPLRAGREIDGALVKLSGAKAEPFDAEAIMKERYALSVSIRDAQKPEPITFDVYGAIAESYRNWTNGLA